MKKHLTYGLEIRVFDSFRDILKRQKYESIILPIINRSKKIFREKTFQSINAQSHGECDFVDNNGIKYDAKLLIDKRQGALIGDRKNNFDLYAKDVESMINEFSQILIDNSYSFISKTRLYGIMKERLDSVENDENVFFYLPFPLVNDFCDSILQQFATDFLQAVYSKMKEDGFIGNHEVFFIYPSSEIGFYVLRNADGYREFIRVPELDSIITFEVKSI